MGQVFDFQSRKYRSVGAKELLVYQYILNSKRLENLGCYSDIELYKNEITKKWEKFGSLYGLEIYDKFPRVMNFRQLKEFWQC